MNRYWVELLFVGALVLLVVQLILLGNDWARSTRFLGNYWLAAMLTTGLFVAGLFVVWLQARRA